MKCWQLLLLLVLWYCGCFWYFGTVAVVGYFGTISGRWGHGRDDGGGGVETG